MNPRSLHNRVLRYDQVEQGPGWSSPIMPGPLYARALQTVPLSTEQASCVRELIRAVSRGGAWRMVHAETGAGKTNIAIPLLAAAADTGRAAIASPTRLLAAQHLDTLGTTLGDSVPRPWTALRKSDGILLCGTQALANYPGRFDLLVVDEEQRYGAKDKAEMEQRAGNVIYLTATPIPRTAVHLPIEYEQVEGYPFPRLSPIVRVGRFRWRIAERMIRREIRAGGQAIFIHHPIAELPSIATRLSRLGRVSVLHGRLTKQELEAAAYDFRSGQADILVATTIVESGIDIPRVNTLVTDCGHLFGLGQLHQILGRVGRSGAQGYAYMGYAGKPDYLAVWRLHACQERAATVSKWDAELRGTGIPGRTAQVGRFLERLPHDMWE